MSELKLDDDEAQALHETLEDFLADMRTEINHTDDRRFKAEMKKRQGILQGLLDRIELKDRQAV